MYPPAGDVIVGMWLYLFVPTCSNLARSDPPTRLYRWTSMYCHRYWFFQSGRGGCPHHESFHNEHSTICLNPLSTWKFTHHMFIRWFGSYLLPGDHTDHMHQSDPPGLLRWPDPAHGNSVRWHSSPDCGMSGILQSTEWSQPCLVDMSCTQSLTPTLHIDSTQYGNAAQ